LSFIEAPDGALLVSSPFLYRDGDGLPVYLETDKNGKPMLTDKGHSLMRLSYDMDVDKVVENRGNRNDLFKSALFTGQVKNHAGRLVRSIDENTDVAQAVFRFIQTMIRVNDLEYLNKERVRSTFKDDVHDFVMRAVGSEAVNENWSDPENDPDDIYPADYKIDRPDRPVALFALTSDSAARDATISALHYEKWGLNLDKAGIMETSGKLTEKVESKFRDAADDFFVYEEKFDMQRAEQYLKAS
jgi:hypothetical protein